MRIWAVSTAMFLGLAGVAQAGPLNFKQVAADAKWVVHLDVDEMHENIVAQRLYESSTQKFQNAEQHLDRLGSGLAMDPRKDLHEITVYSKQIGQHQGVVLVNADVNREMLLEKAKKAPGHQSVSYGPYEIHSWTFAPGKKAEQGITMKIRVGAKLHAFHEHHAAGAFFKPNILVFAETVEDVKGALDVLDGKATSLYGRKSPLTEAIPAGTTILARAVDLSSADCDSALLKQSDTINIVMGEDQGRSFLDAALLTKSAQAADQIKQIVDGARALAQLQHGGDAQIGKLLGQIQVQESGTMVSVALRAPAEDVATVLEKVESELAKHFHKFAPPEAKPGPGK